MTEASTHDMSDARCMLDKAGHIHSESCILTVLPRQNILVKWAQME